jgi:hypothetical protein
VPRARPAAIILAPSPLRERLQELLAELESLRDEVGQLELECETLRGELAAFEVRHRAELAPQQRRLQRIASVVRQMERWVELLEEAEPMQRAARARRVERQRTRELHQEARAEQLEDEPAPEPAPAVDLKSLYRRLARRFHPDLARTEEEQVRHAALMARINALYRAGDRAGLEALADRALGSDLPEPAVSLEEELRLLEERRARFESARDGLRQELQALRVCATSQLLRRVRAAAEEGGRNLFAELRAELATRCRAALADVRDAAGALEDAVRRANRRCLTVAGKRSLDRAFDPLGRQKLVRLSLEALEGARAAPEARAEADRIAELARNSPAAARLVLFAYASELVPHPLDGLRTYEDLALRFESLGTRDRETPSLERALVDAADLVEFGIRRAGARLVQSGLRFRTAVLRDAVPLALRKHAMRVEFRRVLATLGERNGCPRCGQEVFAVPLFRLRGLDDLHANACPQCGDLLSSYFLPRGKDVQSVLNTAFLDLELLSEWSFRMGSSSVSVQLLPVQVERTTVAQLKRRFWSDVLERHGVPVPLRSVRLLQSRRAVAERRKLGELDRQEFVVAFSEKAKVSVTDALETVRHRIRTRFRPEATAAGR